VSTVFVEPSSFQMASSETLPLGFDPTALLDAGEQVLSPSCTLTNIATDSPYAAGLSGSPSVVNGVIRQTVTGLRAKQKYRMAVSFTPVAGKTWTMVLEISCPF
jgi:hypothetical protein